MITDKLLHLARAPGACLAAGLLVILGGCTTTTDIYVDSSLSDVRLSQIERLQHPRPTELIFTFKTKGLVDTTKTHMLAGDVTRIVEGSGLFSAVDDRPVRGGAILSIEIESFPDPDSEALIAVASTMTMGLVGSTTPASFACTMDYIASDGSPTLTTSTRHAIYLRSGGFDPRPKKMVMVRDGGDALHTVVRQSVTGALKQLSNSPAFRKVAEAS